MRASTRVPSAQSWGNFDETHVLREHSPERRNSAQRANTSQYYSNVYSPDTQVCSIGSSRFSMSLVMQESNVQKHYEKAAEKAGVKMSYDARPPIEALTKHSLVVYPGPQPNEIPQTMESYLRQLTERNAARDGSHSLSITQMDSLCPKVKPGIRPGVRQRPASAVEPSRRPGSATSAKPNRMSVSTLIQHLAPPSRPQSGTGRPQSGLASSVQQSRAKSFSPAQFEQYLKNGLNKSDQIVRPQSAVDYDAIARRKLGPSRPASALPRTPSSHGPGTPSRDRRVSRPSKSKDNSNSVRSKIEEARSIAWDAKTASTSKVHKKTHRRVESADSDFDFDAQTESTEQVKSKRLSAHSLSKLSRMGSMAVKNRKLKIVTAPMGMDNIEFINNVLSLPEQERAVAAVAFHPDGYHLATAGATGDIHIWCTQAWKCIVTLCGHSNWVQSLAFDPEGNYLVSGSDDRCIKVWDTTTWLEYKSFPAHTNRVRCVALSPDGAWVVSGSIESVSNLKIWSAESWEELRSLPGHTDFVRCCAFSACGTMLATGSDDCTLKIWSTMSWMLKKTLINREHPGSVMCCAFSPNGIVLVTGGEGEYLTVWCTKLWEPIHFVKAHLDSTSKMSFNPLGSLLLTCSTDCTLKLWDTKTWTCARTFEEHNNFVKSCCFNGDGNMFVSVSCDRFIKCWAESK